MLAIYTNFVAAADRLITAPEHRNGIIVAAMAVALSNATPLPSSPVENPSNYFSLQVLPGVKNIVAPINECVVMDCQAIIDQVRNHWLLRYNAAHPAQCQAYPGEGSFFESLQNVFTYFSCEQVSFFNAHKAVILELALQASWAFAQTQG